MNETPTEQTGTIDTNASCIVQHSMQVHAYSVSRDKLEAIRLSMSSGSDELAFGFFLLSLGLTSLLTLLVAQVPNATVRTIFCVAVVVGLLLGGFMVWKWWRMRRSATKIIDDILNAPEETRRPIQ